MRKPNLRFKEILNAINHIEEYAKGITTIQELKSKHMIYDAVLMNLVLICEISKRLSEPFKNANVHIDWNGIDNYRDLFTQNYFGVDENVVWAAIQIHLPQLKTDFENLLK